MLPNAFSLNKSIQVMVKHCFGESLGLKQAASHDWTHDCPLPLHTFTFSKPWLIPFWYWGQNILEPLIQLQGCCSVSFLCALEFPSSRMARNSALARGRWAEQPEVGTNLLWRWLLTVVCIVYSDIFTRFTPPYVPSILTTLILETPKCRCVGMNYFFGKRCPCYSLWLL